MKPSFYITDRNDKKALWVRLEDEHLNIWDLTKKELTEDVQKAILSAFYRGSQLQQKANQLSKIEGFNSEWTGLNAREGHPLKNKKTKNKQSVNKADTTNLKQTH